MKVAQADISIQRGGIVHESTFRIQATAKAFAILSSGLYARKVEAIIRELSCNAFDSHVAAGKKHVPFDVHLPNAIEPHFSVRDYGIGLSHDDVMHLYTTYFESTKTNSDDFVGALGLGSKSPFCYVDSFTVTSWFNGERRTYTAFIAEDGVPAIAMMGEAEKTDEGNGLEVKMQVKKQDIGQFANDADKIYRRFDPKPKVTGYPHFQITEIERLAGGTNRALVRHDEQDRAEAIQGFVAYPLDPQAFNNALTGEEMALLSVPVEIKFEIGELQVAASREALQYDKKTVANIKTKLQTIASELRTQLQAKFDQCKSVWEAKLLYQEWFHGDGKLSRLLYHAAKIKLNLTYNGERLDVMQLEIPLASNQLIRMFESVRHPGRFITDHQRAPIPAQTNVVIFIDDVGRGAITRLREYRKDASHQNHHKIVIQFVADMSTTKPDAQPIGTIIAALEEMGIPYQLLSSLPKPARQLRNGGGGKAKVMVLNGNHSQLKHARPATVEMEEGGIYVLTHHSSILIDGKKTDAYRFSTFLQGLYGSQILTGPIYAVPATLAKQFTKQDDWVELVSHVRDEVATVALREALTHKLAILEMVRRFNQVADFEDRTETLSNLVNQLTDASPLRSFYQLYDQARRVRVTNDLESVVEFLEIKLPDAKLSFDLVTLYNGLKQRYPLFEMLFTNYSFRNLSEDGITKVADYINLIDQQKAVAKS